jgi:Fe-S-cluster containining protein
MNLQKVNKNQPMSSQEKMIKKVFDEGKFLTEDSEINYACNACGRCCQNQDIILSTLDILRLRRGLEAPTMAFLKSYVEVYPGGSSKMPVCLLKFVKVPEEVAEHLSICPFLKPVFYEELDAINKEGKTKEEIAEEIGKIVKENADKGNMREICSIHDNKPEICRLYPLGRGFAKKMGMEEVETKYFMVEKEKLPCSESCYGCEHKRTVKDLLKANNLGTHQKIQEKYNNNICNLGMVSSEGKLSDNEFSMLTSLLYNFDSILFFQKLEKVPSAINGIEEYKKIKEFYEDIPPLNQELLLKTLKKDATEEDIHNAYENLVEVQTLVINKLVQKYGDGDKKNKA